MAKCKITGTIVFIAATILTIIAAQWLDIDPPTTHMVGAFGAAAALIIVSKLIKIDDSIFFSALIFIFLASPMGSILNLYRSFGPYDKIVHFISGILLAVFGMEIMRKLMGASVGFTASMIFAACMFSSGAAGIWEIFEFIIDKLAGGEMQRGMVDTVTDMIAGNTGALAYGLWALTQCKKVGNHNKSE